MQTKSDSNLRMCNTLGGHTKGHRETLHSLLRDILW